MGYTSDLPVEVLSGSVYRIHCKPSWCVKIGIGFAYITDWASRRPNKLRRVLRKADNILIWGYCQDDIERLGTLVNKVVKRVMDDEVTFDAARREALGQFIVEEELPDQFRTVFLEWYAGITAHLAKWVSRVETAPLIGFSGSQGSGKSTLVKAMSHVLRDAHGIATTVLSLDDFYLPKSARQAMAETVHPLFATRGVPGTHDLALLTRTIAALRGTGSISLPRFDKATDDRTEMVHWRQQSAPVELILLEGWCIGIPPQSDEALAQPVNETEVNKDADHIWRAEVNRQLEGDYAELFAELDALLLLQAPSFDAVFNWRWQQEQRLSRLFQRKHPALADPTMTQSEVADFVLHYQRLTEHGMATLPGRSDCVWELTEDRSVGKMRLAGLAV